MDHDPLRNVPALTWFALIYLSGFWPGFVLPLRFVWVVIPLWVAGGAYLVLEHGKAMTDLVMLATFLPLIGLVGVMYVWVAAFGGVVSGQLARRLPLSLAVKVAGALLISIGLIYGSSALSPAQPKDSYYADKDRQAQLERFQLLARARAREALAHEPRIAAIAGEPHEDPDFVGITGLKPATGVSNPTMTGWYIVRVNGPRGMAFVGVSISGKLNSRPKAVIERVGPSYKDAQSGQ